MLTDHVCYNFALFFAFELFNEQFINTDSVGL